MFGLPQVKKDHSVFTSQPEVPSAQDAARTRIGIGKHHHIVHGLVAHDRLQPRQVLSMREVHLKAGFVENTSFPPTL